MSPSNPGKEFRDLVLRSSELATLAAIFHFRGTKPSYLGVEKSSCTRTSSKAIVILATGDCLGVALGNGDMSWKDFLSRAAGRRAKSYTMDTIFSHKMWS
ncbi:Acetyl-coenzyme A synthetase [Hordeum vulgare]|nr:Acetyl-coenzyme A synthetase [Hordeum vulgare]